MGNNKVAISIEQQFGEIIDLYSSIKAVLQKPLTRNCY